MCCGMNILFDWYTHTHDNGWLISSHIVPHTHTQTHLCNVYNVLSCSDAVEKEFWPLIAKKQHDFIQRWWFIRHFGTTKAKYGNKQHQIDIMIRWIQRFDRWRWKRNERKQNSVKFAVWSINERTFWRRGGEEKAARCVSWCEFVWVSAYVWWIWIRKHTQRARARAREKSDFLVFYSEYLKSLYLRLWDGLGYSSWDLCLLLVGIGWVWGWNVLGFGSICFWIVSVCLVFFISLMGSLYLCFLWQMLLEIWVNRWRTENYVIYIYFWRFGSRVIL